MALYAVGTYGSVFRTCIGRLVVQDAETHTLFLWTGSADVREMEKPVDEFVMNDYIGAEKLILFCGLIFGEGIAPPRVIEPHHGPLACLRACSDRQTSDGLKSTPSALGFSDISQYSASHHGQVLTVYVGPPDQMDPFRSALARSLTPEWQKLFQELLGTIRAGGTDFTRGRGLEMVARLETILVDCAMMTEDLPIADRRQTLMNRAVLLYLMGYEDNAQRILLDIKAENIKAANGEWAQDDTPQDLIEKLRRYGASLGVDWERDKQLRRTWPPTET